MGDIGSSPVGVRSQPWRKVVLVVGAATSDCVSAWPLAIARDGGAAAALTDAIISLAVAAGEFSIGGIGGGAAAARTAGSSVLGRRMKRRLRRRNDFGAIGAAGVLIGVSMLARCARGFDGPVSMAVDSRGCGSGDDPKRPSPRIR